MLSIDLRMLHASGIGTVLSNLLPLLISNHPDTKFSLLCKHNEIKEYSWAYRGNVRIIGCEAPTHSISEQIELFKKIPKNISLFWSPHWNIPLFYRGRLLVTVHDVFHLAMPEYVGGLHKRLYARGIFTALKHKASKIICVSRFTANELMRLTGVDSSKIRVVYSGVDVSWFNIERKISPYSKPYLLFVGNVKPHKNLVRLVDAFELLIAKIPHDLIIVGKKDGFITGDKLVQGRAAKLGNRIYFTGYINDDLLRQYFIHAEALILPSLYEGFGLPPLEAMACGCPVIVSNIASLPEVCGNAVLYCDPYSPKDIAEKIMLLINNEVLREELRQKGLERAKQFSWEKSACDTWAVIEDVLAIK